MKFEMRLENVESKVLESLDTKVGNIEIKAEYSATEVVQLMAYGKEFVKELLKELPEMICDMDVAEQYADKVKAKNQESQISPEFLSFLKDVATKIN